MLEISRSMFDLVEIGAQCMVLAILHREARLGSRHRSHVPKHLEHFLEACADGDCHSPDFNPIHSVGP